MSYSGQTVTKISKITVWTKRLHNRRASERERENCNAKYKRERWGNVSRGGQERTCNLLCCKDWTSRTLKRLLIMDHLALWSSSVEQNESPKYAATITSVLTELGSTFILNYANHPLTKNEQGTGPVKARGVRMHVLSWRGAKEAIT